MLTWPHDQGDWAPLLAEVTPVFQRLALEIAQRETLLVNCLSPAMAGKSQSNSGCCRSTSGKSGVRGSRIQRHLGA